MKLINIAPQYAKLNNLIREYGKACLQYGKNHTEDFQRQALEAGEKVEDELNEFPNISFAELTRIKREHEELKSGILALIDDNSEVFRSIYADGPAFSRLISNLKKLLK